MADKAKVAVVWGHFQWPSTQFNELSIHQYTNTSIHQYINTPIYQHINTLIHQYINTSIQQYIITSIHQYINFKLGSLGHSLQSNKCVISLTKGLSNIDIHYYVMQITHDANSHTAGCPTYCVMLKLLIYWPKRG